MTPPVSEASAAGRVSRHDRTPRIAPLEAPFEPAAQAVLERMNPPGAPSVLALFRVLARHPALVERMAPWAGYLLGRHASVSRRERELVIDRMCARCGAEYEWGVHVAAFAGAVGFDKAQLAAITREDADLAVLAPRERLLVRMVDELHERADIGDALWESLAEHWSEPQLIELILLAGWYRTISGLCNAARVPLEAWQARFADVGAAAPAVQADGRA
jgi:alkylhydroperoxidase family enzyme